MRAILFDYGGTLDSNGIPWLDRFYPIYRACGVKVPKEEFDRAFYDSDDNLGLRHALSDLNLKDTLTLQISNLLRKLGLESNGIGEKIRDQFLSDSRRFLMPNKKLLIGLRKLYKLGIVSNFYGNLASVLKGEGLSDLFDVVADSGALGVLKPDKSIFNHALDKMSVKAQETLMVGDSFNRDILGAEALGMPHAWLYGDRYKNSNPSPCCDKGIILKNLEELPSYLTVLKE